MERKKNTSLIVLTDHTAYGDSAVRHGASLAVFFEAALIVISRFSFFTKNNPKPAESQEFRNILSEYEGKLKITVRMKVSIPRSCIISPTEATALCL